MLRVGITGGIGSGKSILSKILSTYGYAVFNSDFEAKNIVDSNKTAQSEIIDLLGEKAFDKGVYNRQFVASKVFENQSLLGRLNEIIHPKVRKAFEQFVLENNKEMVVFNEAAILFETGAYKKFDKNILVSAPMEIRLKRVLDRDQSDKAEVLKRMNNQLPDEQKRKLTDFEIVNDNDFSVLLQLEKILSELVAI